MKRKWIALAAVLLLTLVLGGCSFKNKVLDGQMEIVLACLNNQDAETLYQRMYPGIVDEQTFSAGLKQIQEIWQPTQQEDVKLVRLNVNTSIKADYSEKNYQGVYKLTLNDEPYYVYLYYAETSEGKGIVSLNVSPQTDASGVEVSQASVISLVFTVVFWLAAAVTVIDVIRKKPRRYGWYILLALLNISIRLNGMKVVLPIGAIVYWGIRGKLLRKKAEWLEAQKAPEEIAEEVVPDSSTEDQE